MIRKFFALLLMLILFPNQKIPAQLSQGDWRDHLSYNTCYRIADVGEWVYCAAQAGLISYNKNSFSIRKHSKATGLSDVLISTIAYSPVSDFLVVGYDNGNIDLLREGESPVNISDIKRKIMTADKKIYDIYIYNQYAFLSCGFGIVVVNLDRKEIEDTYILGENGSNLRINDIAITENKIYAATEAGIRFANLDSVNLLDFNNWILINDVPQPAEEYKQIEYLNDQLFAVYHNVSLDEDKIITIKDDIVQEWGHDYDSIISGISSSNGYFTISSPGRAQVFNSNDQIYQDFTSYGTRHVYVTEQAEIFVAATYSGFTRHINAENTKYFVINGPRFKEVNKISSSAGHIWVSSGGPKQLYKHGAAYSFIDEKWTSYLHDAIPTRNILGNTYKFAIDPRDPGHVYSSAYRYGLIEFLDGEVANVIEINDQDVFDNISENVDLRISGLQFDNQNNLWILMDLVSGSLFMIDAEGNWSKPEIPEQTILGRQNVEYADLLITRAGDIWVLSKKGEVVVLKENGSGGFEYRTFSLKNQYDTPLTIGYCLEEDTEGNVWVGTNNGPVFYYPGSSEGSQVYIVRNDGTNNYDLVLSANAIYDIEIDGGNRKWFATDNAGVFLTSADLKEILFNFTEDNSPLLSNSVTGIEINDLTGEVFFVTSLGIISYGGNATKGFSNYNNVYVYPNPVRPKYSGPITITGLVENSLVKITDIGGNLVWEMKSLGGLATWDGCNFEGRKVATGVYLIMLATEDGIQSHITKLLFIH